MKKIIVLLLVFLYLTIQAQSGIVNIKSSHTVNATADSLVKILTAKGMKIFARIDHAKGAESVEKQLRPTQLVIFGNPKIGTVLLQCNQLVGIDLPQKMLIWQDEKSQTWISYNNPNYLVERHDLQNCNREIITKIYNALNKFAERASK